MGSTPSHRCSNGKAGYPSLRLLVLVSCGTRTVLDAVFGPTTNGETFYAPRLVRSRREGLIVLLDRNFAIQALVEAITGTGAQVLVRVKEHRRLPFLERFPDGSYLSSLGAVAVRVIDGAWLVDLHLGPEDRRHAHLSRRCPPETPGTRRRRGAESASQCGKTVGGLRKLSASTLVVTSGGMAHSPSKPGIP
jgi:DDE family transposase